jgi:hypothetical protein
VDLKLKYIPSSLLSFEKFIQIADDYVLTPWPLGLEKKNKERERERERERDYVLTNHYHSSAFC